MSTLAFTGYYKQHYVLPANTNLNVFSTGGVSMGVETASDVRIVNDGHLNGTSYGNAPYDGVQFTDGGNLINGNYRYTSALIEGRAGVLVGGGLGTISNFGVIRSSSALYSSPDGGVDLFDGGSVTNGANEARSPLISGEWGVFVENAAGTVVNFGTILGLRPGAYAAVKMTDGGAVTNGTNADVTALMRGGVGVDINGAGGVANFGTIVGSVQQGVVLYTGGNVTNGAVTDTVASISGVLQGVGLVFDGTVTNFGAIAGSGAANGDTGVELNSGGQLTNGASSDLSATISGYTGALLPEAGSVTNYGTINGVAASQYQHGVYLVNGGHVTNGTSQDKTALVEGGTGVGVANATGFVGNYGTILSQGSGNFAAAIELRAGGGVFNGTPGDVAALAQGSAGVRILGGYGVVDNLGTITASRLQGVALYDGGMVFNGTGGDTRASISGNQTGVKLYDSGTVTNFGAILSFGVYQGDAGVDMAAGGSLTNGTTRDLGATINGYSGVLLYGAGGTVTNYGSISGLGASLDDYGVALTAGGTVNNGAATDRTALIEGAQGVFISGAAGLIRNSGTILATAVTGFGAALTDGGFVANGSFSDPNALIQGYSGLFVQGGTAINLGVISSVGAYEHGVDLEAGAAITNGAAGQTGGLIEGYVGVYVFGTGSVTNFGTIKGATGGAVVFTSPDDVLNVEAGSTFVGAVDGGGGTLDLASGVGTLTGLLSAAGDVTVSGSMATTTFTGFATVEVGNGASFTTAGGTIAAGQALDVVGTLTDTGILTVAGTLTTSGTLAGTGTLALAGGTSNFDSGTNLTIAKVALSGASVADVADAWITYAGIWTQAAGKLSVAGGDKAAFTGAGDTFAGTVSGAGSVLWSGGSDTFSGLTLSATSQTVSGAAVTLSGVITVDDNIALTSANLVVAAGGATIAGTGEVILSSNATNSLSGASSADTLTVNGKLYGAGQLGAGQMGLTIGAGGFVDGYTTTALTINTGTNTIANAGIIYAIGSGGTVVDSAVDNTGRLWADGGTLTLDGAVTGAGIGEISTGTLFAASTFTQNVTFTSASTGTLELANSHAYTGDITGFSLTGANALDLGDIAYVSGTTKATYSGTTTSGTLTVTSGSEVAHITLEGNYTTSTFTLSSDGHGGTTVVDPTKTQAPAAPSPHAFVAAMAAIDGGGATTHTADAWRAAPTMLAAPGLATA